MGEPITKEILSKYKGWRLRVKMDNDILEEMRSAAEFPSTRENDGSQHQPRVSGGSPAVDRMIDLANELDANIKENERKMLRIVRAINNLSNPMEQNVLMARYIDGPFCELTKWAEVAMKIYQKNDENAVQNATRLHGRALKSIAKEEF